MEQKVRIAIMGGGYGGVEAAKRLHKKYKRKQNIDITLIDRNPYHTLMTELHEVAGSRVEPEAVQVSFKKIFSGTSVKVVCDEIDTIEFENKRLVSRTAVYPYDYLIIGAGAQPDFFDIPGVQENCFTCWSLEDAIRIRTHIEEMFREAAKEPSPERRRKLLTFAVAGGSFTGVEICGELLERKEVLCAKYHINEREVRVVLIEMLDDILPSLPKHLREKAARYLQNRGTDLMLNSPITSAAPGKVVIADSEVVETDTFIWTAGVHGSEFSSKIELTKGNCAKDEATVASVEGIHGMKGCHFDEDERYIVGERGRIQVNEFLQSVDVPNVYIVGDMVFVTIDDKVVPQIVETAIQSAHTAAENIAREIEQKEKKPFKPNYHGQMVSLGGKYGVAYVMNVALSGFAAQAMKHVINLHYLIGLAGLTAIWDYLQEQFFQIRDGRSIVGSHLAAKIPAYWALPLRVFLGIKWVTEGVKKVSEGWLNPGPGGLFNVADTSIHLPGVIVWDEATAATAAATSATPGADSWGEPIMEALGLYTWFAENVLGRFPTMAFLAQSGVVVAQVVVGLALILGLFTFPAAVISLGMALMFIVSGWGNVELWWFMTAAIVMLGGAGRGFGLDHWVMPWMKRWWNRKSIAHKTHLYTGEPRIKN
ncbi:MAG: NAD(P)/FAD-dependent oxidoreductase [Spirochaetaceae bacterium]|nr:MAG: NAD(P)/FAD-dependent oxidoreductase [Spirochaetaceae bacterium]